MTTRDLRCRAQLYLILTLALLGCSVTMRGQSTPARDNLSAPMTFSYQATDPYYRTGRFYILAEGTITSETPEKFLTFFKSLDRGLPVVYFNSLGGDLSAGIKLGRLIRKLGLDTFVGGPYRTCYSISENTKETSLADFNEGGGDATDKFASEETCRDCSYSCDAPRLITKQGVCVSACAYAFIGGAGREIGNDGYYGVHQFRSLSGVSRESSTQVAMTVLAGYLDEMAVDRRLLDLASLTSPNDITKISSQMARQLNIDNNNPPLGEWEIDANSSGELVAYISQKLPGREAKIGIFIRRNGVQYSGLIRFNFVQAFRSSDEIADAFSMKTAPEIFGDEFKYKLMIVKPWTRQNDGSYALSFRLSPSMLKAIAKEQSFTLDSNFPNVYRDILSYVNFSTHRLERMVTALQKQR